MQYEIQTTGTFSTDVIEAVRMRGIDLVELLQFHWDDHRGVWEVEFTKRVPKVGVTRGFAFFSAVEMKVAKANIRIKNSQTVVLVEDYRYPDYIYAGNHVINLPMLECTCPDNAVRINDQKVCKHLVKAAKELLGCSTLEQFIELSAEHSLVSAA